MAERREGRFQDFEVLVEERDSEAHKYVLRVGLKGQERDVASRWFSSCVANTSRLVHGVKEAHSKKKEATSPTKADIGIDWNGVVDFVIQLALKEIQKTGSGELELPDILPETPEPSGFFKTHFSAKGGVLADVGTLERYGDAKAVKRASNIQLDCAVSLRTLVITYKQYEATLWGRGLRGGVVVHVGKNAVRGSVVLKMKKGGECHVSLAEVKVEQLAGVKVKLTGLGPLNGVVSRIASWRVGKMRDNIAARVEEVVMRQVTEMLEGFRCDDFVIMMKT